MVKELNILIGIKEENLSELLKYHSTRNNFDVNTFTATSGEQLRYKINNFEYDGVITDYDLDDKTAVDVLNQVETNLPFIIHSWYHNKILEQKALNKGALALKQKNKHLSYFNELVYMVSKHSNFGKTGTTGRPDIKLRINSEGRILQGIGLDKEIMKDVGRISDISPLIDHNQVEEAIVETLDLGDSTLEAVMEDSNGLVNYNFFFTKLDNGSDILVTALPKQELQYIDKEIYTKMSDSSGQTVRD